MSHSPRQTTLELNQKSIAERYLENPQNTWKLNILLNNTRAKEEISRKIVKYFEINENVIYHNLWHEVKTVLKRKFIALHAHIRK